MLWTVRKRIELRTTAWELGALTYEPPLLEVRLSNYTITICMRVARSNTKKLYYFLQKNFPMFKKKNLDGSISILLFSSILCLFYGTTPALLWTWMSVGPTKYNRISSSMENRPEATRAVSSEYSKGGLAEKCKTPSNRQVAIVPDTASRTSEDECKWY